ncbi:hypothetical protein KYC5002_49495 [Archangium violaceum]|uniref:hypothetical protein n=1 Tax=Archangium violaceum TaxID=83451 RepID=UPI002B288438|nr:hypothetical protein KYC5002_49495 [Archangium gephyra]
MEQHLHSRNLAPGFVHGTLQQLYILEPSAAAGLAALRKLLPRALGPTVVVLTGRNVSWHRFEELVRG